MRGLDLVMASYVDVLEHMPEGVEVISINLGRDWITVGNDGYPDYVEVVTVSIHAHGWKAAQTIAKALRLAEVDGDVRVSKYNGRQQWRNWVGWVDNGFLAAPVSVEVKGAEHIDQPEFDPGEFAPFIPATDLAVA